MDHLRRSSSRRCRVLSVARVVAVTLFVTALSPLSSTAIWLPHVEASEAGTVNVSKNGSGTGTVTTTPAGINCGLDCSETWADGTWVEFKATADAGSRFQGWAGDLCTNPQITTCLTQTYGTNSVVATFARQRALTVTFAGSGGGEVSVSNSQGRICSATCTVDFDEGQVVTLTASVYQDTSKFSGWSGGGCSGTGTCMVTMDAAKSVTATFTSRPYLQVNSYGSGTVSSSPAGISCAPTCFARYDFGTSVTLTATPSPGRMFTAWAGACLGTAGPFCTVVLNGDTTVGAEFTSGGSRLTVAKVGLGTVGGTVYGGLPNTDVIDCGSTCSGEYRPGDTVRLDAAPAAGYRMGPWSGCTTFEGPTCFITVPNNNFNVTAEFIKVNRLTVTRAGTGSGSVTSAPAGIDCGATCAKDFDDGTQVTLTATTAAGSIFTGWSGGGCAGTGTCQITLDAAKAVTATFVRDTRTLAVAKAGGGSGTVTSAPAGIDCGQSCTAEFGVGSTVTLTAAAAAGSSFTGWSGGGCSGTGTCQVTLNAATGVTATFNAVVITRTLTLHVGGDGGKVTVGPGDHECALDATCTLTYEQGTELTLTAAPDAGVNPIVTWTGGSCAGSTTLECKFTLTDNQDVSVSFYRTQTLTVSKVGSGTGTVTSQPAGIDCGTTCSGRFIEFSVIRLTATAAPGSTFTGWSAFGCDDTGPCDTGLGADALTVTATFVAGGATPTPTVTATATATPTVTPTATATATPTPPPATAGCKVPKLKAGTRLASVKRKLKAARCKAGKVKRVSSKVRRGRLVRLKPKAGTVLAVNAAVGIVVSKGPRRH
jgi:hypothetical protein